MNVGDVYIFSGNRCRVLMFDTEEVFYASLTHGNNSDLLKYKTVSYYRTTRDFFETNATFIASSRLTEDEKKIHRPDLPLKLNCFREIFWTNEKFDTKSEFISFLNSKGITENELEGLKIDKVVIFPQGQLTSLKKPVTLENNLAYFSATELMFNCFDFQHQYIKKEKPYFSRFRLIQNGREEKRLTGIGLYRLGIKGNIPSYYLGGYMSQSDLEIDQTLIV